MIISKLAEKNYIPSPNANKRIAKIDTITIHHAAGVGTAQEIANIFKNSKGSCNYCIGYDGTIACSVAEEYRSWASNNANNDHRAITFEVSNDGQDYYNWSVSEKALEALIVLIADCCKRNDIKALKWSTKKDERKNHLNGCNMTVHRDFVATACPGQFLFSKMNYIAEAVNAILNKEKVAKSGTFEKNKVIAIVIENDTNDYIFDDGIEIKKFIHQYTSRNGEKGGYFELICKNSGNYTIKDKNANTLYKIKCN